jgi:hypothetical protein
MSEHTKEPWGYEGDAVIDAEENIIAHILTDAYSSNAYGADYAIDARRIVACVNALQHISTDDLESGELLHMGLAIKDLTKQRDELLAALKEIIAETDKPVCQSLEKPTDFAVSMNRGMKIGYIKDMAKKAIAKTKGGAA